MSEKVLFVTMIHKVSGVKISGVHPDAVPAHEAIGYVVLEPEAKKQVEPEIKAADNDTAHKIPAAKAAKNATTSKTPKRSRKK